MLVRIQPTYLMNGVLFMEEVFAKYEDTAGNLHWHGTETGEHIIKKQDPLSNFQIPDKCKYCGYYYNFLCRAEQCIKDDENPDDDHIDEDNTEEDWP